MKWSSVKLLTPKGQYLGLVGRVHFLRAVWRVARLQGEYLHPGTIVKILTLGKTGHLQEMALSEPFTPAELMTEVKKIA